MSSVQARAHFPSESEALSSVGSGRAWKLSKWSSLPFLPHYPQLKVESWKLSKWSTPHSWHCLTISSNIEQYRVTFWSLSGPHSITCLLVCLLLLIIVASFEWIVCPCTNIECMQQQPHRVRVHSDQCFKLSSNLDRAASCILQFILTSSSLSGMPI